MGDLGVNRIVLEPNELNFRDKTKLQEFIYLFLFSEADSLTFYSL